MPIMQSTASCPACGAIVAIQASSDDGASWQGPDNRERHAEWHAEVEQRIKALEVRAEGRAAILRTLIADEDT